MNFEFEPEFDRTLKERVLNIVKRSWNGETHLLDESDTIILFHWVRHMNDPMYEFVPKKYRTPKKQRRQKNGL